MQSETIEKYLIILEDGAPYISNKLTTNIISAWNDGIVIVIVRLSDQKEYSEQNAWIDLKEWKDE